MSSLLLPHASGSWQCALCGGQWCWSFLQKLQTDSKPSRSVVQNRLYRAQKDVWMCPEIGTARSGLWYCQRHPWTDSRAGAYVQHPPYIFFIKHFIIHLWSIIKSLEISFASKICWQDISDLNNGFKKRLGADRINILWPQYQKTWQG